MLGTSFDPERHKCGVDVAFSLPTIKPSNIPQALEVFLENKEHNNIGINISGLIYNDPANAKKRFGFKSEYNQIVRELINRFLNETDCRITLVPHVVTPKGHYESDVDASYKAIAELGKKSRKESHCRPFIQ